MNAATATASREHALYPVLRLVNGGGRSFTVRADSIVIGRNADCDVPLDDETVSKRHARIRREANGYTLTDLRSRNHTFLNSRMVPEDQPALLRNGDKITICEFKFVFECPEVVLSDVEDTSTILASIEALTPGSLPPRPAKPEVKLAAVLEIGREIGTTLLLQDVLDRTLSALFQIFPQADRGFILLRDHAGAEQAPRAIRLRKGVQESPTLSRTLAKLVLGEGKAILSASVPDDSRLKNSQSLQGTELRTLICVPIVNNQRVPVGLIQIDTARHDGMFTQEDLDLLMAVAGPVGLAVDNSRLHRLQLLEVGLKAAHDVQMAMVGGPRPDLPGYEFWETYIPALEVGGDYFGYLPLARPDEPADRPGRTWAVTVADVSDKGMPAALTMARLSAEVRHLLLSEQDPRRVLQRLNRLVCDPRFPERFVTLLLVLIDAEAHRLTVLNAGHMGPMIRRASGRVEIIGEDQASPPLGIDDEMSYEPVETPLHPGDVVVLYTDGISEATSPAGEWFKASRVQQALLGAPSGASAAGQAILTAAQRHASGVQSDDMTLVSFGRR